MTSPSLVERGRRAGAAALLVVVSAGVAQAIVTNPEPASTALLAAPTPTSRRTATPRPASPATTLPAKTETTPTTTATAKPADPRALAVAWYADRHHLDRSTVTALQADKVKGAAYRVLLMVAKPGGRLDSAVVTVTPTNGGAWQVEASRG